MDPEVLSILILAAMSVVATVLPVNMGAPIPLAAPFLMSGGIAAAGLIVALAVSSTIVDVSPFSTNGALVLANAPESMDRDRFYKQILIYATGIVVLGPLLVWGS